MVTQFSLASLDVKMPDGAKFTFWFDGNGKITVGNGTFSNPKPNAFSLVQIKDCPFATPLCKSICYVHRLEKAEREVHDKYQKNSETIRAILANRLYQKEAARSFAEWIEQNCPGGFRWHVSGDIISLEHANFIRMVCGLAKNVNFWIYTRSFPYLEPIDGIENLVVNLSADQIKTTWKRR